MPAHADRDRSDFERGAEHRRVPRDARVRGRDPRRRLRLDGPDPRDRGRAAAGRACSSTSISAMGRSATGPWTGRRIAWVLIVDADERVPPELAREIESVLARGRRAARPRLLFAGKTSSSARPSATPGGDPTASSVSSSAARRDIPNGASTRTSMTSGGTPTLRRGSEARDGGVAFRVPRKAAPATRSGEPTTSSGPAGGPGFADRRSVPRGDSSERTSSRRASSTDGAGLARLRSAGLRDVSEMGAPVGVAADRAPRDGRLPEPGSPRRENPRWDTL